MSLPFNLLDVMSWWHWLTCEAFLPDARQMESLVSDFRACHIPSTDEQRRSWE